MKKFALIAGGGSGTRMKSKQLKQFLLLQNKPIILRTLEVFASIPHLEMVVVLPSVEHATFKNLIKDYADFQHKEILDKILLVEAGETRFHSVRNGLEAIPDDGLVAIHDAV